MDIELMDAILAGPASNLTGLAADFAAFASRPDSYRHIIPTRSPSNAPDALRAARYRPRAKDGLARFEQNG